MSDWLDKLAKEIAPTEEEPPKGWMTTQEISQRFGWKSAGSACRFVKKGIKAGKLQRKLVRRNGDGGIKLIPYYGPK